MSIKRILLVIARHLWAALLEICLIYSLWLYPDPVRPIRKIYSPVPNWLPIDPRRLVYALVLHHHPADSVHLGRSFFELTFLIPVG